MREEIKREREIHAAAVALGRIGGLARGPNKARQVNREDCRRGALIMHLKAGHKIKALSTLTVPPSTSAPDVDMSQTTGTGDQSTQDTTK